MSSNGVVMQRRRSSVLRRSSIVRARRDSVVANENDAVSSPLRRVIQNNDSDLLHLNSPVRRFWQVRQPIDQKKISSKSGEYLTFSMTESPI